MAEATLVELIEAYERSLAAFEEGSRRTGKPYGGSARMWNRYVRDRETLHDSLGKTGPTRHGDIVYIRGFMEPMRFVTREASEIDRVASEAAGVTVSDDDGEVD